LFALAQQVMDQAPEGHSVHAFVPAVHFERWIYFGWNQDTNAADREGYFRARPIREQVNQAARKSVASPGYQPGRQAISDRNMFSMAFWLMGDHRAQLQQMKLTGPVITSVPWNYAGDPAGSYRKAWKEAAEGRKSR
jgi:hypothetical protein